MKNLSLNSVKAYLTRDEMRTVSGGSGIGFGCLGSCKECSSNGQCCSTVCAGDQPLCGGGKRCLR